jgi:peptide/nickel transport system permease protein
MSLTMAGQFHRYRPSLPALTLIVLALLAATVNWWAPQDPFNPASFDLLDAKLPPAWLADGTAAHLLGTDNQGRDLLSLVFYGLRLSLIIGCLSVASAMVAGVLIGLACGYYGGILDGVLMRIADIQLSFPPILIALFIGGLAQKFGRDHDWVVLAGLVVSIAATQWVMFARMVRGLTMSEKKQDYILACQLMHIRTPAILAGHILPNISGPIGVLATINIGSAVLLEATLSFLGVGLPPTSPSLGTLIRIGNEFVFSGYWWMAIFPGLMLVIVCGAINLCGDRLRGSEARA